VGTSGPIPLKSCEHNHMSEETIQCRRCEKDNAPLPKAPFRSELGDRILAQVCSICWQDWLQHQTALINHYGLDPRDQKSKDFLYKQIEQVLFEGSGGKEIDTSMEGSIEW